MRDLGFWVGMLTVVVVVIYMTAYGCTHIDETETRQLVNNLWVVPVLIAAAVLVALKEE